jgi:hypothetical protein
VAVVLAAELAAAVATVVPAPAVGKIAAMAAAVDPPPVVVVSRLIQVGPVVVVAAAMAMAVALVVVATITVAPRAELALPPMAVDSVALLIQ